MDDQDLLRYSRQIMLPEVDIAGQEKLLAANVVIVGVGGLGAPAALYLAATGVGQLTLVDDDVVEISNLQRQIVHTQNNVGQKKTTSASKSLAALNPDTRVVEVSRRLDRAEMADLFTDATVVIDATDNFETRYDINDACFATGTPLVSGAAIRFEGQVTVFDPRDPESPCYRCLYSSASGEALNCAENGVIAPLVGVIGSHQAMECVKLITGVGDSLAGRVVYYDAKYGDWRTFKLSPQADCPTCRT